MIVYNIIFSLQLKEPPAPAPPRPRDFVDPVTYRSGPLSRQRYKEVLRAEGFVLPTRKRKAKAANATETRAAKKSKPNTGTYCAFCLINIILLLILHCYYSSVPRPKRASGGYLSANKSGGNEDLFWDHIGRSFLDVEENIRFIITDVCTNSNYDGIFFFQYYVCGVDTGAQTSEMEYTSCDEILSEVWSQWCNV